MIDLVAELDALLVTWRARRTTPTAALIDELSSWFALVLPGLPGTRDQRHRAWLARARLRRAIDLPLLLATVAQGTRAQAREQLEVLTDWPIDPRMTWLARRLYQTRPYATSSGDQKVWRRLFDLLEKHVDPRALAVIDASSMAKVFDATERGRAMRERAKSIVTWIEMHDVELTADDRVAHDARAARLAVALESGRALRDAARLEEDDEQQPSRLVYLDWLMERGYVP